jgi:glutamate formiminotransferase
VSEGRDRTVLDRLADEAGDTLLDRHSDPDHHRTVFTLAGTDEALEASVRRLTATAVELLDLGTHHGRHPRMGVVDVVPFVPLVPLAGHGPAGGGPTVPGFRLDPAPPLDSAVAARDRFARWAWSELSVPCFCYGPLPAGGERALPEVRRLAFEHLSPDQGDGGPHPTAGACAVGARGFLVAYNLWLDGGDAELARAVARQLRCPGVRALGLDLSGRAQVSCNLVDPVLHGPAEVHDRVACLLEGTGAAVDRGELVGLVPAAVLDVVVEERWADLGLDPDATVEGRLEARRVSWR